MADDPPSIPEHSHDQSPDSSCPFCTITSTYQPISPLETNHGDWDPDRLDPPTYVLLSTEHVVAFLDIAPLTRGHVLVAPRRHRVKVGNLQSSEAAEIGRVLPLIARSVLRSVFPDIPHHDADYNVVQNNGPGAAQVIPHVHFHVIPRPPLDYKPATGGSRNGRPAYAPSQIPTGLRASYVQFGRGQRHELDEDDAAVLVKTMRENLKSEWEKEFGGVANVPSGKEQKL
ncbi:hypothetical protein PMZ80_001243 [Knufia obscura]|uniref:HIT domain-containing protein n=2 Tax=Knufia TaxID=430999 RepID=A0AAN8FDI0_9EURO|nr:hypothetical protein PMZ80_001243 [Knufia obscura]KAK5956351.1 hypothetical protein OHC33_002928 [Knufia fluminis]